MSEEGVREGDRGYKAGSVLTTENPRLVWNS